MKKKIFRFKQFEIDHTNSAMKVGVDSVLLGAIVEFGEPKNLLDIGSGSGLLSIMAAQKTKRTVITGIELEIEAFKESVINCCKCPWSNRLGMVNDDVNYFQPTEKFDYIISNPPYFQTTSQCSSKNRNLARQNNGLSLEFFFINIQRFLSLTGECAFIYPASLYDNIKNLLLKYNFFAKKIINIYPKDSKLVIRHVYILSNSLQVTEFEDVVIRCNDDNYTSKYKKITEDFYL